MTSCLDCSMLAVRLESAAKRESERLAELDRLKERIAELERVRRTWTRITCDRCGASLEVAATLAMPDHRRNLAMLRAVVAAGWWLSNRTFRELEAGPIEDRIPNRDLCPGCAVLESGGAAP